jgi:hypothetical protein
MSKSYFDTKIWADRYVQKFLNCDDKAQLTEEIDAAYARANSIERNRDMRNSNWIDKKKAWIRIAQGLQEIRKNV